jgi:hypothetical protein
MTRRRIRSAIAAVALALGASGCAHARAKVPTDLPPLAVPPPPPRLVEPADNAAPEPMPLPEEPARHAPPAGTAPPRREGPRAEKSEPPKPEPPAEPAKPPDDATPPTILQTTPTVAEGEVERSIRAVLNRASGDLSHIDYRTLNADARTQYDTAKRFIAQSEKALDSKNLVFAKNLADKAAALAAQLSSK